MSASSPTARRARRARGALRRGGSRRPSFILMDHVEGVEMGVGAYFDGERFLEPACLDWEHKRFFAGDMGELTGEMGTVATYERSRRFFERRSAGSRRCSREHGHVGYVNLNTIVNEDGIWPLEFTCRFGYPGFADARAAPGDAWGELFRRWRGGAAALCGPARASRVGIVLTTPPFPYSRKQVDEPVGLPVFLARISTPRTAPPPLWRGRARRRPARDQRPLRLDDGGDREPARRSRRRRPPPMRAPAESRSRTCATGSTSATG
jgi:hypothetical protein